MTSTNPGSKTETYLSTDSTVETYVVPRIVTKSDQIAHYFVDDLEKLVDIAHIDLVEVLQIPIDYSQDASDIILMLHEDLSHMLRDQLITGIHLLLSDKDMDANTGAYPLRYHADYVVGRSLQPSSNAQRFGGNIAPPKHVWRDARFTLLIDWNPSASDRRRQVRRPDYCFDWVPEEARFDATSLVRYREGGMSVDGATVTRDEAAAAEHHKP